MNPTSHAACSSRLAATCRAFALSHLLAIRSTALAGYGFFPAAAVRTQNSPLTSPTSSRCFLKPNALATLS